MTLFPIFNTTVRKSNAQWMLALLVLGCSMFVAPKLQGQVDAGINPVPGDALLAYWDGRYTDALAETKTLLEAEDCTACAALRPKLDRIETVQRLFLEDLNRAFDAFAVGPDSLLLGRLDMAALQLPLKDLQGMLTGLLDEPLTWPASPSYRPGLYRRAELEVLYMEQRGLANGMLLAVIDALESQLDDAVDVPVFIAPEALNMLYTGLDNPVRVFAGNADPESVTLKGPGAAPTNEPGVWTVKPEVPGPVELVLEGRSPSGAMVQGSAQFRALRVPEPDVFVAGRSDGVLVKRSITAQTGVSARHDEFLLNVGYTIKGFELVYTPEYGSPATAKTPGNKFSAEMLQILARTKPGDRVVFRVAVQWPDGSIKTLSPIFYVR